MDDLVHSWQWPAWHPPALWLVCKVVHKTTCWTIYLSIPNVHTHTQIKQPPLPNLHETLMNVSSRFGINEIAPQINPPVMGHLKFLFGLGEQWILSAVLGEDNRGDRSLHPLWQLARQPCTLFAARYNGSNTVTWWRKIFFSTHSDKLICSATALCHQFD